MTVIHIIKRHATRAAALIASALSAVVLVAAPVGATPTAPTHITDDFDSGVTSLTLLSGFFANPVSGNGETLMITWASKEGASVTPVAPTLSMGGSYTIVSSDRIVYDDAGATRGQIGVMQVTCSGSGCNSDIVLSFGTQNQSAVEASVDQFGVGDTLVGVSTAGSSTGTTSQSVAAWPGSNNAGDIVVLAGAHQANEATTISGSGTWTTLASDFGPGNGSLGVGYAVMDGANPVASSSSASWTTSVPGGVLAYQIR